MEYKGWDVLTVLKTAKVGRALWMTTEVMKFQTPNGIDLVPYGRLFDHASVPRLFSNAVPPVKSSIAEASLWHDEQYCKDTPFITRKLADEGLKYLTIAQGLETGEGVDDELAHLAYTAVRVGAKQYYDKQYNYEKIVDVYKRYHGYTLAQLQDEILGKHTLEAEAHDQDCLDLWESVSGEADNNWFTKNCPL